MILRAARWLLAAALLLPVAQTASALSFTIDPSSTLTGDIAAGFSVRVFTSLGNVDGDGMVEGTLGSTPTGSIDATPVLGLTQLQFDAVDIDSPSPGDATGDATLDIFGFIPLTLDVTIDINSIGLDLASMISTPLTPAGAGLWTFSGNPNLLIGANAGGSASGPLGIGFAVPAFNFGGTPPGIVAPITGTLESLGAAGTQLTFVGSDLTVNVPLSGMTEHINLNQCIGGSIGSLCLGVRITGLDLTLDYIEFSNVNANIVATTFEVVPEPTTAVLLGGGLIALAGLRRRA